MNKIRVENLSKKREELLVKYENSWDKDIEGYKEEWDPEIDVLSGKIVDRIKTWKDSLPFEFIIEELTNLGHAPCLLYDDEGRFTLSNDGIQTLPAGEAIDMEMTHWVGKDKWKNSIREALNDYLKELT
jgi:hypothetical protein